MYLLRFETEEECTRACFKLADDYRPLVVSSQHRPHNNQQSQITRPTVSLGNIFTAFCRYL